MADPFGEEDICAGCSLNPLEVSLVLVCNHRLCLTCAKKQMILPGVSDAKGTYVNGKLFDQNCSAQASCPVCRSVTQVESGAAQQILSIEDPPLPSPQSQSSPSPSPSPPFIPSMPQRASPKAGFEGFRGFGSVSPELQTTKSPLPAAPADAQCSLPKAEMLQTCGQCQVEAADVRCWQCDEFFCHNCYKKIHHVGRMKEHRSTAFADPGSSLQRAAVQPMQTMQPSAQAFEICVQHGEPIHFFCLDCTRCLCPECAVHRGGCVASGHDVQNVKRAFKQLSGSIHQLLETAGAQLHKQSAQDLTQQLDDVHSKGKQDLRDLFSNLEGTFKAKEEILLKGMEESGRVADQLLLAKARQCEAKSVQIKRLRESLDAIRTDEGVSGNEIQKINSFVAVQKNVAALLPLSARCLAILRRLSFSFSLSELMRTSKRLWF